jgi:hypothetical protein
MTSRDIIPYLICVAVLVFVTGMVIGLIINWGG